MTYTGHKKVRKKLNGVKKGYTKQLKRLPKKAVVNNPITKISCRAIKTLK